MNGREEPFWQERRATPLPDSLLERIALFEQSGRIVRDEHELFAEVAWLQLLVGQGVVAGGYHPLADALPAARREQFLDISTQHVAATVARMPTHDQFLRAHCPAPDAKVAA